MEAQEIAMPGDGSDPAIAIRAEFERQEESRSWFAQHPAIAVSMLGGLLGALLSGVQVYTSSVVSEAVTEVQTKTYRNDTRDEIVDVKAEITALKGASALEHSSMRSSIRDVGILNLEQGKSNRKLLEAMAKRRGVKVEKKSQDLKDAEEKVEALPAK